MSQTIGAVHDFHDPAYVQDWARRFTPTAPRIALFETILQRLLAEPLPSSHVVELGIGPGYMARFILERLGADHAMTYEGVDFSEAMFDVARGTIGALAGRVTMTTADLLDQGWTRRLAKPPGAIISTWALHDLGSEQAIADVYAGAFAALPPGGVLLNGDFIRPDRTDFAYEPGRIEIGRHLELLAAAGFAEPRCIGEYEPAREAPTAATNYACFEARR